MIFWALISFVHFSVGFGHFLVGYGHFSMGFGHFSMSFGHFPKGFGHLDNIWKQTNCLTLTNQPNTAELSGITNKQTPPTQVKGAILRC